MRITNVFLKSISFVHLHVKIPALQTLEFAEGKINLEDTLSDSRFGAWSILETTQNY